MLRISWVTLVALGAALSVLAGCNDGASSRGEIQPSPTHDDPSPAVIESKPAPHESQPADAIKPPEEPQSDKPQPEPPQDATAKSPPIPDYLTVLERIDDHAPATATGQTLGRSRLVIDTRNVKRIRITRSKLSFAHGRSIPLRIDGQVFEMKASSDVVELERSRNGEWSSPKKEP